MLVPRLAIGRIICRRKSETSSEGGCCRTYLAVICILLYISIAKGMPTKGIDIMLVGIFFAAAIFPCWRCSLKVTMAG